MKRFALFGLLLLFMVGFLAVLMFLTFTFTFPAFGQVRRIDVNVKVYSTDDISKYKEFLTAIHQILEVAVKRGLTPAVVYCELLLCEEGGLVKLRPYGGLKDTWWDDSSIIWKGEIQKVRNGANKGRMLEEVKRAAEGIIKYMWIIKQRPTPPSPYPPKEPKPPRKRIQHAGQQWPVFYWITSERWARRCSGKLHFALHSLFEHLIFPLPVSTIKDLHLGHFSPVGLFQSANSQ